MISSAVMTRMTSMPRSAHTGFLRKANIGCGKVFFRSASTASSVLMVSGPFFGMRISVRPSQFDITSATFQNRIPMGRSPAAATLVHSSIHFTTATHKPLSTSPLKPRQASYRPSERQKILGVLSAPVTPFGYFSSGLPATEFRMLWAAR